MKNASAFTTLASTTKDWLKSEKPKPRNAKQPERNPFQKQINPQNVHESSAQ